MAIRPATGTAIRWAAAWRSQPATGYQDARPGYEVRTLIAAANILARHGQQQQCEDVLATTRDTYKLYVADMHSRGVWGANVPNWQQQQIAAAQPVTANNTSFRSDQLLGTEVRNLQDLRGSSLNNSSGRLAGVAGAEQALGFWYDLVAEAGSTGANGVRTRHAARYGDFAEFASGRRQAG